MSKSDLKIAYIITAHKDPDHFDRLIRKIYSSQSFFFIHIDKNAEIELFKSKISDLKRVKFLKQFAASWGEIGIIKAEILALKESLASDIIFDYIILISGQDYPIKSVDFIHEFLLKNYGKSFINILPMPFQDRVADGMHTLERYYFKFFGGKYVYPPFKKPRKKKDQYLNSLFHFYFKKREIPYSLKPFGGEHWWCLHKSAVRYIIDFLDKNPKYLRFHRYSLCADEMFFHTILGNATEKDIKDNIVIDDLRYIDWSEGNDSPKILDISDLESIVKSSKLFARKFDSNVDSEILNAIDKIII